MKMHYATLRLGRTATEAQIKAAYRVRARELHPDRDPTVDPQRFVELSEAYQTLTDSAARAAYDEMLATHCQRMRWVLCDECGQPNRVPRVPPGQVATCGRCRKQLPAVAATDSPRRRLRDKAIEVAVEVGADVLDATRDYLHQRLARIRTQTGEGS